MSIVHCPAVDSGLAVNMNIDQSINREGSILEYSRLKDMTLQAWSPFQKGYFEGVFLNDREKYAKLNDMIDELAQKYGVTTTAIAVAWLTRHPANMQVVLGTTNVNRVKDAVKGSDLCLTRQEWYGLYAASGKMIPDIHYCIISRFSCQKESFNHKIKVPINSVFIGTFFNFTGYIIVETVGIQPMTS